MEASFFADDEADADGADVMAHDSGHSPLPAAGGGGALVNGTSSSKKDDGSRDSTYFSYYSALSNQQNMLQDTVRTGTYQWAIAQNKGDFADKVVLDVGAGSGILSFFALQAGARKVYAVEASDVATFARQLVAANNVADRIIVINGKLEDVQLPEKVDLIVSEPMGVLLVHERMIETFVRARIDWLKEDGAMFPASAGIFLSPFTDAFLYNETISKARFWQQEDFYGVNLSALANESFAHHFSQPVVGCFDPRTLIAAAIELPINFLTVTMQELQSFDIPFRFASNYTGICHGIAGWFDVHFNGSTTHVCLSTSPFGQKTHWYQIRFLFKTPLAVNLGQVLKGKLALSVNDQRSYRVVIDAGIEGTNVRMQQSYQLHEQQYWYPTLPDPSVPILPEANNLYTKSL